MPESLFEEKYRPDKVKDVLGQENHKKQLIPQIEKVIANIKKLDELYNALESIKDPSKKKAILDEIKKLKSIRIRHQIFTGNAGVGKTTMAIAIGKEIFGSDFGEMFHEFNASDERGIDVIREEIKGLTQRGTGKYPFMIIFLDEADNLTIDAQMALKRIIERAPHCVFILACNTIDDVIDPLKSRNSVRKFKNISMEVAVNAMSRICAAEGIKYEPGFLEELYLTRSGDLRSCIGKLGEFADFGKTVTIDMLDDENIRKDLIKDFYLDCINGRLRKAFRSYQKSRIECSINQSDFIAALMKFVLNLKRSNEFKADVFTFTEMNVGKRESDAMIIATIGRLYKAEKDDNNRTEEEKTYEQKIERDTT